jgi:hypothetical protein
MRLIRNLLASFIVLASIIFGAVAAIKNPPTFFSMPADLTSLADKAIVLVGGSGYLFFTCLGFCVSGLVTVFLSLPGGRRNKDIRVDLEGGSVVMSESAIRSYLEAALAEFPQIGVRRIDIFSNGRGLLVQMQADLKTQQHVPDLEQSIITRIHVALVNELGISKVQNVRVSVSGFRPSTSSLPKTGAPEKAAIGNSPRIPVKQVTDQATASELVSQSDHDLVLAASDQKNSQPDS